MRAKLKKKKLMLLWRSCRTGRRVEFSPKTEAGTPLTGRVTPGVLEAGNFDTVVLLPVLKNTANLALVDLGTSSGALRPRAGSRHVLAMRWPLLRQGSRVPERS